MTVPQAEKKNTPLHCCDLTNRLSHLTVNTLAPCSVHFRALLISTKKHVLEFQSSLVAKPCKLYPAPNWGKKKFLFV